MQHGAVADRDARADLDGVAGVDVADDAVLQVRPLAERDRLGLRAQYGVVPDARARREAHLPDDDRAKGDEGRRVELGGGDAGDGQDPG
ncbi:hypothetical protein GCM10009819_37340 [Agromyces tropicus]|uniref:Uncharacterized protein n=1 Tax=Agromyces tropicus TaxID=555371 RepID=A0ABN2UYN8_9MICO